MEFDKITYTVEGLSGFPLSEALRLFKAKYPEYIDFRKDIVKAEIPTLIAFADFVQEVWDSIIPVSTQEALAQPNNENRRVYFSCIGVQKLFEDLEPNRLDRQTIVKKRYGWDDNNKQILKEFQDVYELYQIDGRKMFEKDRFGRAAQPVYAVRCWCTTTHREYWIYVPMEAAVGRTWLSEGEIGNPDAIRAIAWTIRLDVSNPERIYRQGDIIVAKLGPESKTVSVPYHLEKDQYLNLMYSES